MADKGDNQAPEWLRDGHEHIWLPYTQMQDAPMPLPAVSAKGARITLADGRELVDGVSSWWTACHGYCHPHIEQAVKAQVEKLPHVMLGGFANEPAYKLATRLANLLPGDLNHSFFSESGSVAVEVAMKMAVQYHRQKGTPNRNAFISFLGGYHGDTGFAMSVCDPEEGMHGHFASYLPRQHVVAVPEDEASITAFEAVLAEHAKHCAAIIIEPMVQGAGGFKMHDAAVLQRLRDAADAHGLLLIFDEIMTGFGRLGGSLFVCEKSGVVPDIITLSKALTGGTMPLAATIATNKVFDAFKSDSADDAFMHGPTYSGNALACAAANASLDLFESEPRLEQVAAIEAQLTAELTPIADIAGVVDVRVQGALGVVQVTALHDVEWLKSRFIEQGAWIRPFGDVIYLMPPFVIDPADLTLLTKVMKLVIFEWSQRFIGEI